MINPYDLMLGNWVLDTGAPIQVFHIVPSMYGNVVPGATEEQSWKVNGKLCSNLHPIPLTPELLIKMKWKKRVDNEYLICYGTKNNYSVCFPKRDDEYRKIADPITGMQESEIVVHYLHELQNIYRWETGKQLEVIL